MTGQAIAHIVIVTSDNGFGPAEWATIIAAAIAAIVALAGYALTQAWARRERHARTIAGALAAVESYLEAPYRVRRRPASTPEVRAALTSSLSDLQAPDNAAPRLAASGGPRRRLGLRSPHIGRPG